jgi:hypothetical protein
MPYHHLLIRESDDGPFTLFMWNVTEKDLEWRIVGPYRASSLFSNEGKIRRIDGLREIKIVASDAVFADENLKAFAWHKDHWIDVTESRRPPLPTVEQVAEQLPDVTSKVLHGVEVGGPPRKGALLRISENPLISTVVGTLAGIAIGYYLGVGK